MILEQFEKEGDRVYDIDENDIRTTLGYKMVLVDIYVGLRAHPRLSIHYIAGRLKVYATSVDDLINLVNNCAWDGDKFLPITVTFVNEKTGDTFTQGMPLVNPYSIAP